MAFDPNQFDSTELYGGFCHDPMAHFGCNVWKDGLFFRTFQPNVDRVTLIDARNDSAVAELKRIDQEGLFETRLSGQPAFFPYRYRMTSGSHSWELEDPYSFGPVLGELDRYLMGEGNHLEAYRKLGAHPCERNGVDGVAFALWAPNARRVSVVGSFNHWDGRCHLMQQYAMNGVWELFIPRLVPGDLYKFEIQGLNGNLIPLKSDPFAFHSELAPNCASIVHGLTEFKWRDKDWMKNRYKYNSHKAPVTVFEVHLGSWRRKDDGSFLSYLELADQLIPYVKSLGYTHIQLLPVSEHPYYASWGYQPLGLFAPTSRYGKPDDFKAFVNIAHQAGLGVFLDWVPAHFPEDSHGLAYFDGTHLYEHADPRQGRHQDWGTLIYNYGREEVRNYLIANALFWLEQFHIDGLRVDAVASMLYLNYSRKEGEWIPNRYGGKENLESITFLRRLNEVVYSRFSDIMMIAEESTAWPGVSRPTAWGGLGFGLKWDMGWMHDTLRYLGRHMLHRRWHHNEITFSMLYRNAENFVLPLSHDEVVHGKKSLLWRMPGNREEQFANLRLLYAWQFALSGKKMLFMGGEFAQDREWNHNCALDWYLLQYAPHQGITNLVRDLNSLYKAELSLYEGDCEPGGFRWIDCADNKNNVLALARHDLEGRPGIVVVLNLSGSLKDNYRVGVPQSGVYKEALNTDSAYYGGWNHGNLGEIKTENIPAHNHQQSLRMTLPPLSALFLKLIKHD
ncbi:MAG: 1,4-alpha-glucan branching protein GlgB [Holophagales bacterium]|jgi:1,4-alpha-glucan branching enzyme|nr:1,4-alpha-glucan branching protein GlgB [Holophagales bacterium]